MKRDHSIQARKSGGFFSLLIFFGVPHLATCIFLIFYKEPELGAEIYPGMALTPLPYSIYRDRTHDLTIVSQVP
jgi:hypothetical protein